MAPRLAPMLLVAALALPGCSSGGDDASKVSGNPDCLTACELAPDAACQAHCQNGCSKSACLETTSGDPVDFTIVTTVECNGATLTFTSPALTKICSF